MEIQSKHINTTHQASTRERPPPQITTPPGKPSQSEERDLQINYGLLLLHHGKMRIGPGHIDHHSPDKLETFQTNETETREEAGRQASTTTNDNSRASHTQRPHTTHPTHRHKRRDAAKVARCPAHLIAREEERGQPWRARRLQTQKTARRETGERCLAARLTKPILHPAQMKGAEQPWWHDQAGSKQQSR